MRISERKEISSPAGATLVQVAIRSNGEVWGIMNDNKLHASGGGAAAAAASTTAIQKSGHIVRYNEVRREWDLIDTPETAHTFISLAASFGTEIWAITDEHEIYKYADERWEKLDGKFKAKLLAVGNDGNIWAVSSENDNLYHHTRSRDWEEKDKSVRFIAIGDTEVWQIGFTGRKAYRKEKGSDSWYTKGEIGFKQLVITSDDEIWGIDEGNNVCKFREIGGWRSKGIKLDFMAIGKDGEIWGILNERVYRWPSLKKQYADAAIVKINEFLGDAGDRIAPDSTKPALKPSYLQLFESKGIDIFGATSGLICLSILLFYMLTERETKECSIYTKEYAHLKWATMLTATIAATMGAYCLGERITASCRKIYPTTERLSDSLADSLKKFGIAAVRATIERGAATVHVPVDVHGNPIGVQGAGLQRVSAST